MKSKLTIIVVTYNSREVFLECFDNIYKSTKGDLQYIIVDNSTNKDNYAKKYSKNKNNVEYIKTEKNLGWGGACNLGVEHAKTEYVYLMNDDVYTLDENWALNLIKIHENRKKNTPNLILNPLLVNEPDKKGDINYFLSSRVSKFGFTAYPTNFGKVNIKEIEKFQKRDISLRFPSVGNFFIKKEDYKKTGGYNSELFFLYHEDGEYAARLINTYHFDIIRTNKIILLQKVEGSVHKNFKSRKKRKLENHKNANLLKIILIHYKKKDMISGLFGATLFIIAINLKNKNWGGLFKSLNEIIKKRERVAHYRNKVKKIDFKKSNYYDTNFRAVIQKYLKF